MRRRNRERGGSTFLEFTLVGIPVIFLLISVFEMCRGMWTYHTLAAAVKAGTRYTAVHGQNCAQAPNACTVTIGQIATRIQSAGPGLLPGQFNLTFTPASGSAVSCAMSDCLTNATQFPATGANAVGNDVAISGSYPFRSIISMSWTGAGTVGRFGVVNFGAASKERIQY